MNNFSTCLSREMCTNTTTTQTTNSMLCIRRNIRCFVYDGDRKQWYDFFSVLACYWVYTKYTWLEPTQWHWWQARKADMLTVTPRIAPRPVCKTTVPGICILYLHRLGIAQSFLLSWPRLGLASAHLLQLPLSLSLSLSPLSPSPPPPPTLPLPLHHLPPRWPSG